MATNNGVDEEAMDGRCRFKPRVEGKKLEVLRTSVVKPSTPTPSEHSWVSFTHLDFCWLQFYTPLLCVYPSASDTSAEELRSSLEKALALFYPLAGRVFTTKEKAGIECNDAGAVFTEASIDAELSELQYEDDFQPSFVLSGMAQAGLGEYPRLPPESPDGRPALIVQVTHFKCGGITVAANWAHAVADGFSGFHFMKSWAELSRGQSEPSLLPDCNRGLLKPRDPVIISNPFSEHYRADYADIADAVAVAKPNWNQAQEALTVQMVEITKELVDELKQEIGEARISRVSLVTAHVWRALTKARGMADSELTRMWTLVEGRKKLSLPEGFFGNCIGSVYTTVTVDSLLNKPLAYSAGLIAATIQHATKDYFQDLVDWMEAGKMHPYPGMLLGSGYEAGNSWQNRFPYYEMDFGFGAPVWSVRNACAGWDGFFPILPSVQNPDNFTAMVHAPADVMAKFLPLLHHYPSS